MDVTPLAAQVIERRQFEIDQYRIAFDHGSQPCGIGFADQRADIGVPFTDIARQRRSHHRVTQLQFGLLQIGLAHRHARTSHIQRGYGIVQIELARGILLIKRTQALYVAFGLGRLRFVLLELRLRLFDARLILIVIDIKEGFVHADPFALFERHFFEKPFDPGIDLDTAGRLDQADIIPVNFDIVDQHIFHPDHRNLSRSLFAAPHQSRTKRHPAKNVYSVSHNYIVFTLIYRPTRYIFFPKKIRATRKRR